MAPLLSPPAGDMSLPPPPSYRHFQANDESGSKVIHDERFEGFAVGMEVPSATGPTKSLKGGTATSDLDHCTTRKQRLSILQQRAQERVQRRREEQLKQQE